MKKWGVLLVVLVMGLSLTACTDNQDGYVPGEDDTNVEITTTTQDEQTTTTTKATTTTTKAQARSTSGQRTVLPSRSRRWGAVEKKVRSGASR